MCPSVVNLTYSFLGDQPSLNKARLRANCFQGLDSFNGIVHVHVVLGAT